MEAYLHHLSLSKEKKNILPPKKRFFIIIQSTEILSLNYKILKWCFCCFFPHSVHQGNRIHFIPPAGWWSCCPLCTSPGTGASPPNVCPTPRPPATRSSTVCCGSSTERSWLTSSAGFWEKTSTHCLSTARAARWTPQTTPASPELPELDVQMFKWFNTCVPSVGRSEVRVSEEQLPCRWNGVGALLEDTLRQGWTTGLFKPQCRPLGGLWKDCERTRSDVRSTRAHWPLMWATGVFRLYRLFPQGSVCLLRHRQGYTTRSPQHYVYYYHQCKCTVEVTLALLEVVSMFTLMTVLKLMLKFVLTSVEIGVRTREDVISRQHNGTHLLKNKLHCHRHAVSPSCEFIRVKNLWIQLLLWYWRAFKI